MANDLEFRSFVSKVYLTRSINAHGAGFLDRNLRHALDSHEREVVRERTTANTNESAAMTEPRRTRSNAWDFPSERIAYELMRTNQAKIRIKSILLQDPTSIAEQVKRSRPQEQPDWLPEPDQLKLPCQVVVTISDATSQRTAVSTAARQGTITRQDRSTFEIAFNDPFIIFADDLNTHTLSFTGPGGWKKALHKDYSIEFGIHCHDSQDTAEFLSQLEARPIGDFLAAPGNEGVVKCSWAGLPGLPQAEEALPLHRAKGHKKLDLNYSAHIDMAWNKRESPLSTYNKVLRKARNEPRQLPTPSEDSERTGEKTMVKYAYQQGFETKGMLVNHLRCIFCTKKPEHATFERLHLHYLTRHDHFQYAVRLEESENGDDLRTIRISHEDDKPPSNEKEFEWQAPHQPFDISIHLQGTSSWTVRDNTKRTTSKGPGRPHKEQPLVLARAKKRDIAPEDVEQLPTCIKKRHVVPRVPGVRFYRTKSKQSVEPGTELSDSEDDVDETWLLQRQQQQRAKLGASKNAQQFNELFNKHLDIEGQPQSDVLVRDAVVRFAHEHARQLAQPGWQEEFEGKLKLFQSVNIINAATATYCREQLSRWERDLNGPTLVPDEDEEQQSIAHSRTPTTPNRRIRGNLPSQVRGTAVVFDRSKDTEQDDGVIPESPTETPSSKNRIRWAGGMMKSASVDPMDIDTLPLGQRTLICIRLATLHRPEKSTNEIPITDLIKDNHSQKPIHEIQPSDLDYKKFLRILDVDLFYVRAGDTIVCISSAMRRPVVDETDWHEALGQVQVEYTGSIKFMLGPLDFIMSSQGDSPKKGNKQNAVSAKKAQPPTEKAKQALPAARTKKPCVCGEFVNSPRNTIGCGNPRCHRNFHMTCVQLQKRSMDWLCIDCSS